MKGVIIISTKMNAVLYLRYSSNNQTEQSIEGQRTVCQAFAERNGILIVDEYVDRAASASHDTQKRKNFLQMVADADRESFQAVIVYKLDRFARDRYDFANYKAKLKKHGIRVLSATEAISDNPESIIMESLLEGMAEYYSRELSQKVQRGMDESARKRQCLGGAVPLGIKIENKKYVPDPDTRHIIEEMYSDYLRGMTLREIATKLNNRGIRNIGGKPFRAGSVSRILKNKKYCGIYEHKEIFDPDAIEPIVDMETWQAVQEKLKMNQSTMRKRPTKDAPEFLLKGKVFCGHCGYAMTPDSGTSRRGKVYRYYSCNGKKQLHNCDKKNERKELLEELVINDAVSMLTDEYIDKIARFVVSEYEKSDIHAATEHAKKQIQESDRKINNLVDAIANGLMSDAIVSRLKEAEEEKANLQNYLSQIEASSYAISYEKVVYYLEKMRGALEPVDFQKVLLDAFVERVEVFDDENDGNGGYIRISYRLSDEPARTVQFMSQCPHHFIYNKSAFLNQEGLFVFLPLYGSLYSQPPAAIRFLFV